MTTGSVSTIRTTLTFIGVLLMLGPALAYAHDGEAQPPATRQTPPVQNRPVQTPILEPVVELSFGYTQLFAQGTVKQIQEVGPGGAVPTSSALFIAEWLITPRWGFLGIFNLPLTTQKTVVDGDVMEERVAPSAGLGGRFSVLRFDLRPRAIIEVQATLLAGRTIGSTEGDFFFPLLGGRVHISRPMGFGMYTGLTWAFHKETLALFYGVSHRF